jgi:hypothetical protein
VTSPQSKSEVIAVEPEPKPNIASAGRIVEVTVKAVVTKTGGVRLQVSFGNETALIYPWQIVKEVR